MKGTGDRFIRFGRKRAGKYVMLTLYALSAGRDCCPQRLKAAVKLKNITNLLNPHARSGRVQ